MHFICPKDFKNGKYYFSKYRTIDLFILIGGCIIGFFIGYFLIQIGLSIHSSKIAILAVIIASIIVLISTILVIKISYYHNILEWSFVAFEYLTRVKQYRWKGLYYRDEDLK